MLPGRVCTDHAAWGVREEQGSKLLINGFGCLRVFWGGGSVYHQDEEMGYKWWNIIKKRRNCENEFWE